MVNKGIEQEIRDENYRQRIRHQFSPKFFDNTNKFIEMVNIPRWFFEKIRVEGVEEIQKLKGKQVLYVSNHISMADFLVQGHSFWKYDLPIPRFIGGENLFKFPFKTLWRKSGTMALDRKGGVSYLKIFNEELNKCFSEGESILTYAEGGRNYSGNGLNTFKTGSFKSALGAVENGREIYGVPISIEYDKLVEGWALPKVKHFKEKRDEHLKKGNNLVAKFYDRGYFAWDVFAYVVRPFVKEKGNAYIKFGEPFSLGEFDEGINNSKKIMLSNKFKSDIEGLLR